MKKTITKPDGSVEIVEGTAEEIAEYERKLSSTNVKEQDEKKKDLLLEKLLEDKRSPFNIREASYQSYPWHSDNCELVVAQRGWWSVNPPRCTCGARLHFGKITYTTTDGTIGWIDNEN